MDGPAPSADDSVGFFLFGGVRVVRDRAEVELNQPKQRAILALLLSAPGEPVYISEIIDALWSGEPAASVTNQIHRHIGSLRRAFQPGLLRRQTGRYLLPAGTGYRLVAGPADCDVLRFRALIDEAHQIARAGKRHEAGRAYRSALAVAAAPPGDDTMWALPAFAGLEDERVRAIIAASEHSDSTDDYAAVLPILRAAAARHQLNETLHAQLMTALTRTGRAAEALEVYARIRRELRDELGTSPGVALEAAQAQALRGDDRPSPHELARAAHAPASLAAVPRLLVGRDGELAALGELVVALRTGVGGAALVVGEAGSGKSSLLAALLDELRDVQLVWVTGDELGQGFPLLPLVEAAAERGRDDIERLLRGRLDDGAGVADSVVAASERLTAWLEDLSARLPVVLVFDDLHWADDASLRVWHRLARSARQMPLLALGAMRPGYGRDELTTVRRRVGDLQATGRGALVELGALSEAAVVELVADLVGGRPGKRLVEEVAAAGGNPLYATELVGSLQRSNALVVRAGGVEAVQGYEAGSLVEVIAGRFDLVPGPVRELLQVAALLGVEFSVADLAVTSGRPVGELAGMLAQARAAGVVAPRGAGMVFRHPLIREVLCAQLAPGVRGVWHVELARVLAGRGADAVAVARQLTAAMECGAELPGADWLADWLVAEGPVLASQAVAVAIPLYRQALGQVATGDGRRPELAVSLASALYAAARYEEADEVAGQALAPGPSRVDADHALTLYVLMAQNLRDRGMVPPARAVLDRAEAERGWNPRQQLRLQVTRLRTADWSDYNAHAEAWARSRELLPLAEQLDDPWAVASLWDLMAEHYALTSVDESLLFLDRGLAAVREHPELMQLRLELQVSRVAYLGRALRFAECAEAAAQLRALAERAGDRRHAGHAAHYSVVCLFQFGRWDDLPAEADTVDELGWPSSGAAALAAIAALHRDDEPRAERYIRRVADTAERLGINMGSETNLAQVESLRLQRAGRDTEALDRLVTGEQPAADWWDDAHYTPRVQATRLAVSLGDWEAVEQILRWNEYWPSLHPGVRAQCRGLVDRDPQLLSQAAASYRSAGQKFQLAQTAEDLGMVLAEGGDTAAASPPLLEAVRLYEDLAATWDLRRIRARFREYGIGAGSSAPRDRPASGWASLTKTESRIAGLIADGKSNPEIAHALFLSRRTVEGHVSDILTKLGQRSRLDIARLAATQPSAT
jgi:DNA-binding SARP family transcriptional activator/DNA-binding CsgD family transcriptional regulator